MNDYVCFYKGKRHEVIASTALDAQDAAALYFKAKKAYQVTVILAEREGQPVVHDPAILG